ncbi:SAC3 family protein C [Citrus sinensis]|uniref:SAC3 family protein C n=1 Tax=Citrus sinensis TaxID=2711 RepID=A0ACB8KDU4_CITSI|nr:SAC3 family protein C [Citrus sinensis]
MERRHHSQSHSQRQQGRNHFSSSSSNQSRSNNRFSFPKSSSSSSSANDVRDRRRETQEEKQEEAIVGTCPFMCPEAERLQRQRLRDLAVFERLHGDPRNSSPALAVKKFCRTMSAKEVRASDVRPLPVLEETLNYLLSLLDSTEHPFEVIHDFVFDRTRSVRQDLIMQNIVNDKAINMFEKIVKFHVISHHKLRSSCSSSSISPLHYLNLEQLTKALTSLYNLGSRFLSGFVTCLLLSSSQKKCGLLARPYGTFRWAIIGVFYRLLLLRHHIYSTALLNLILMRFDHLLCAVYIIVIISSIRIL